MIEALPFGPGALIVVAVYILSLLGVGFYAYKQRQKDNMQDFFLAGRNLGFTILFLTIPEILLNIAAIGFPTP